MRALRRLSSWLFVLLFVVIGTSSASALFAWGPAVSSDDEILKTISDLIKVGYRRPGSPAESAAADYVANKFREFGLEKVAKEPVPIKRWDATSWSLSYTSKSTGQVVNVPSFYIPYSAFSKAGGNVGNFVYVKEGSDADYAGKQIAGNIVVAEIRFLDPTPLGIYSHKASWVISNWKAYEKAVSLGAAGFVGILRDYWNRNEFYSPADNPSKAFETRTVPGMWITKRDGDQLLAAIGAGTVGPARLNLAGTITPNANLYNVYGFLPGQTDDVIMVHSHHDAPFDGAVEDASGTAEVIAIAKYFSKIPRSWRKKSMMFMTSGGHFHNYRGHEAFIDRHSIVGPGETEPLIDRILADFCVEHVGLEYIEKNGEPFATGKAEQAFMFYSSPALLPIVNAFTAMWLDRTLPTPWPLSNQGFFSDAGPYQGEGIPMVSYISGPMYIYDSNDTIDKVNKSQLRKVASSFIDMIVATDELSPSAIGQF